MIFIHRKQCKLIKTIRHEFSLYDLANLQPLENLIYFSLSFQNNDQQLPYQDFFVLNFLFLSRSLLS